MIDYKAVFADNLSHLRSHKGWTQLELAEKLNYSDKTVSKWERGESMPDVIMLKQISDLFGITIDELLTDHKGKPVETWKQDSIAPEKKEKEKKEHKTFLEKVNAMDDKGRAHAYKVRQLISVVSVIGVWVLTTAARSGRRCRGPCWGLEQRPGPRTRQCHHDSPATPSSRRLFPPPETPARDAITQAPPLFPKDAGRERKP